MARRVLLAIASMAVALGLVSPPAETQTDDPPRTAWGDPDLQGIWTNATITRLERPEELGDQQFLTQEEVSAVEARAARAQVEERAVQDGNPGTYNQFWTDRGSAVVDNARTSLITDPPDGRIPWTPAGREHFARSRARYGVGPYDSHLHLDTGERCITDGLPLVPLQGYNQNYQILQTPTHIAILNEMYHEFRIVPLDGRPHLDAGIDQWFGDPRGHWEGDTLVIESTNFADKSHYWWAQSWRASRPTLRLIERFTRVDDETIDYQFTMEDPENFTQPWTATIPMTTNQAERGVTAGKLFEFACHEGNYGLVNVLRGARAQEQQSTRR